MKKTTGKKLALNKDTLKTITNQQLQQVAGGGTGLACPRTTTA